MRTVSPIEKLQWLTAHISKSKSVPTESALHAVQSDNIQHLKGKYPDLNREMLLDLAKTDAFINTDVLNATVSEFELCVRQAFPRTKIIVMDPYLADLAYKTVEQKNQKEFVSRRFEKLFQKAGPNPQILAICHAHNNHFVTLIVNMHSGVVEFWDSYVKHREQRAKQWRTRFHVWACWCKELEFAFLSENWLKYRFIVSTSAAQQQTNDCGVLSFLHLVQRTLSILQKSELLVKEYPAVCLVEDTSAAFIDRWRLITLAFLLFFCPG